MSLVHFMVELVVDGINPSSLLDEVLIDLKSNHLFETSMKTLEDFLKAVNTLIKFNKGKWKSDKQGYFLLKRGKLLSAEHRKESEFFRNAVTIAKNMGYEHEKDSIVVLEMLQLKDFGKRAKEKIRYQAFLTILDSGGVVYHGKVKVDHPKAGVRETARLNLSQIETKFTRDKSIVPEIVVDFFAKKKVDKELLSKVQKAIDKVNQSKDFSDRDIEILKSFKQQVMDGNKLSVKQLAILNKFLEERVDIGLGNKSEWNENFDSIIKFVEKLGTMMYKNFDALKEVGINDTSFKNQLATIITSYKSGNIPQEGMIAVVMNIILDRLFHSYFKQSKYIGVNELISEIPGQIKKAAKAKKLTKKSIKILTDMRNLGELMKRVNDDKINREIQGYFQ